jgi:hypothetical protein
MSRPLPPEGLSEVTRGPFCDKVLFGYAAVPTNDVSIQAQGTVAIFSVKAGLLVHEAFTRVITAWTASVTITLGDGNQAAGLFASADIAPQTAVATGIMKRMSASGEAYAGGINYPADDTIDAVVAGATPVAGQSELYLIGSMSPLYVAQAA